MHQRTAVGRLPSEWIRNQRYVIFRKGFQEVRSAGGQVSTRVDVCVSIDQRPFGRFVDEQ
jgi:hypothetical protein